MKIYSSRLKIQDFSINGMQFKKALLPLLLERVPEMVI